MPARVGFPVGQRKCGAQSDPHHHRCARLLSEAMFGRGAAVSRVTGFGERLLQAWMEPQSPNASPFETARRLVEGLIATGSPAETLHALLDWLMEPLTALEASEPPIPFPLSDAAVATSAADLITEQARGYADGTLTDVEAERIVLSSFRVSREARRAARSALEEARLSPR